MTTFELEHKIVANRDRMDELVARHNHLVSLVPEVITQDVMPEYQMTLAEIDKNMEALTAVMAELKRDCERSPYFKRQQTTEVK
jgi:hypothetical protein